MRKWRDIFKVWTILLVLELSANVYGLFEVEIASKKASYLEAQVGSYVVFNCALEFPHETEIPYVLQWNKDVSS